MNNQIPPENWPYGAAFSPDSDPSSDPARQAVPTSGQSGQTPSAAPSGSFPFTSQFTPPTGSGAAAAPSMPFPYPAYTTTPPAAPPATMTVPSAAAPLPLVEQSYIENILRLNLGKTASVYCTFEGNTEWNAKVFTGTVEAAGRDHVIIKDSGSETRYLIPMVFVNYFTFTGPMSYSYPYAPPTQR